jgi:hypothetical protein
MNTAKTISVNMVGDQATSWIPYLTNTQAIMIAIGIVLLVTQVVLMRRLMRVLDTKLKTNRDAVIRMVNKKNK